MIKVNYPEPVFRFKEENGKEMIFDFIRKQWLLLNEEEWVRQNFIQFLVQELKYPLELIAVEKEIQLGDLKKRFDILVYDRDHKPWMLIECKAPEIAITQAALMQLLNYQRTIQCGYWMLSNGHQHFCADARNVSAINWLETLPAYDF